ncbi:hypothetical protein [Pseudoalteromonas ostreae]|uniref:hypothetical protein n=1 Tax=Pseudoalteromonas ostreae TaxID=2774154 RepID=UPI001B38E62C|nr:hypothetical protein [Pseudoalteromonas ostreae]
MAASDPFQQVDIWQSDTQRVLYAQLCNAFYAREIGQLVVEVNEQRLRKRLKSLPYYIERAATAVVNGQVPFQLDPHNGCWLDKQKAQPPNAKNNDDFYQTHKNVGLIVPLLLNSANQTRVAIDSIDQVSDNKLHCNEHGWFDCQGQPLEGQLVVLLKPTKATMAAACCGHQWSFDKRTTPRTLSLREMLLAGNINWRNLKRPHVRVKKI